MLYIQCVNGVSEDILFRKNRKKNNRLKKIIHFLGFREIINDKD